MHIVQLLPELNQGGVERYVIEMNQYIVQQGIQSSVISSGGAYEKNIMLDGGIHHKLDLQSKNPLTLFNRAGKLQSLYRNIKPDLIHCHSRVPAWLSHIANDSLKIPSINTVHGFNSISRYSAIMTKSDAIICVSHPLKKYILKHYSVESDRIHVIHNGIDQHHFTHNQVDQKWIDAFKQKYALSGKTVITQVGRLSPLKDFETFIDAIALAHKENNDIVGFIVGSASQQKKAYEKILHEYVIKQQASSFIHLTGNQTRLREIYSLSDLTVSTTKQPESFGRTLVESLMMNTPVAATHHGGPLDIINSEKNGYFFEPENSQALADLILHKPFTSLTSLRDDAVNRFAIEKIGLQIIDAYNQLLGNNDD
jgi:glycosyltransferase involved in cell wall biosynthesis